MKKLLFIFITLFFYFNITQNMTTSNIDIHDTFNLYDMQQKYPHTIDNDSLREKNALSDLSKCFVYCMSVPPVYIIKDYDNINDKMTVKYTNESIAKQMLSKVIIHPKTFQREHEYTAWNLFKHHVAELSVIGIKFYSSNPRVFSFFRGYDYVVSDSVNMNIIQPFLNHIHDVIANYNDDVYNYILKWIASIFQKPSFKTGTALVIIGAHGSGKNTFFTDIICKLMGRYANNNITTIESIVGKFNALLENKKLLILNELQSIDKCKYLNSDALKSIITDTTININQKNEPMRLCDNVANFIMVSNNNIPIKIENGDRRYVVMKTSDKHVKDWNYFDTLYKSFTDEFYQHLFTFFMTMDINGYNLRMIPETEAKNDIQEASMSSYELFIREHYEEINGKTGPELFEMYCKYAEKNKYQQCSNRTFITNIKQFTGDQKAKWVNGKTQRVYTLLPEVYAKYKKYYESIEVVDNDYI